MVHGVDVALLRQHRLIVRCHQQGAERMAPHACCAAGYLVGPAQVSRNLIRVHVFCEPRCAQPVVCFSMKLKSSYITMAMIPTTSKPLNARPICIDEPAEINR